MYRNLLIAVLLSIVSGCAMTTAVQVTPDNPNPSGIRVYGPKPILIVTSTGVSIDIVPNLSKEYAVRMDAYFSKNTSKLTISENGLLTNVEVELDSAAALQPLLDFARDALDLAEDVAAPLTSASISNTGGYVQVYEFVFDKNGSVSLRKIFNHLVPAEIRAPKPNSTKKDPPVIPAADGSLKPAPVGAQVIPAATGSPQSSPIGSLQGAKK